MMLSIRPLGALVFAACLALAACDQTGTSSNSSSVADATSAVATTTTTTTATSPAATYSVSGVVSGTAGATVKLIGTATNTTGTDANGNYSFASVASGSYTVMPGQTGFVFSPASRAVIVGSAAVSDVVFAGSASTAQTYSISGSVSGAVSAGVLITLNGANVGSAVTDLGGNYTLSGLIAGTYTVNASLDGYTFSTALIVTLGNADSAANNFTAMTAPAGTLEFTPVTTLAQATVGSPYSATVIKSIAGGTAPYHYQSDTPDTGTPPLGMIVNPNGNLTGTPQVPGQYSFDVCATDSAGETSACAPTSVTVIDAPASSPTPAPANAPTVQLTATPATITASAASSLSWSSTNATACVASGGWTGNKGTSGTSSVSPASTTTYTLACSGTGGTAQATAKVTVTAAAAPAPTVTLTTSAATITSGAAATLTYATQNANTCSRGGGWSGTISGSGTQAVTPTTTTTYTLACTGTGGAAQASTKVTVNTAAASPAPVVTMSASPATLTSGASSTITWSSSNASTCTANGGWSGAQSTSGTKTVSPTATTTYSLSCSNANGTGNGSVTVTVNAASNPAPTPAGTSWVYYNGQFDWPGDYSFNAKPDYADTSGSPLSGGKDIKVAITGQWGGWLPYSQNYQFNSQGYTKLTFALKPTVANQAWNVFFVKVGDVPVGIYLDPTKYGPAPVVGQWATYTIPLADLGVLGQTIYKFCIHDETGLSSNTWYVDNVGFVP